MHAHTRTHTHLASKVPRKEFYRASFLFSSLRVRIYPGLDVYASSALHMLVLCHCPQSAEESGLASIPIANEEQLDTAVEGGPTYVILYIIRREYNCYLHITIEFTKLDALRLLFY